ncbi:hypothetical protein QBC39DRAFT_137948 [Podospora conica]|nr:hypothetical protein QBC39DRAFT_137948 [Schizothecium conicum]
MEAAIPPWFGWVPWVPNIGTTFTSLHIALASGPRTSNLDWIDHVSQVARSGRVQAVIVATALLWCARDSIAGRRASATHQSKAPKIRLSYEICAQLSRAAALTILVAAARHAPDRWVDVPPIALALILGLSRLTGHARWRRLTLHKVNFLLSSTLITLMAANILPRLKLDREEELDTIELVAVGAVAASVLIALVTPRSWVPPDIPKMDGYEPLEPTPSPEETCSWFVRFLSYEFLTPMLRIGWRRPVEMQDLPPLPWYDDPVVLLEQVLRARERYKTTFWTVVGFQSHQIMKMVFWITLSFSVELVAPYALYQLLQYISNPEEAQLHPGIWIFLLFAGPMARSVSFQQYIFYSTRLLVRGRSGLTQELYHRAMISMELEGDVINAIATRGQKQEQDTTTTSAGRLANLMANDIDTILKVRDSLIPGVGVPVGIALTTVGLYRMTGWPGIVGILFLLSAAPIPAYLGKLMTVAQRKVKLAQDSRISLITEYLGSIKAIKYFAWEDSIIETIQRARSKEQAQLWYLSVVGTVINMASGLIPLGTLLLIYGLYTGVLGQPLTASVAFTTMSLINTVRRNLHMLNWMIRMLVNASVSLDRLDRFFASTEPLTRFPEGPLRLENATFRRSKTATFRLKDISVDFVEGGLNVLVGQSGSGKTSLLLGILGELVLEGGHVTSPGDLAFASQTPWLQNETIRENILFHAPFEQARYDRVIEGCCFAQDLDELQRGDQTEIGENGTILSGGQKSRVALARALYSKSPVLLLDDIFSALDAKTAAAVWELCFCSDMLKGRTIILVTQVPWMASQADLVVTMEDGSVQNVERNLGVVRKPVTTAPIQSQIDADGDTDQPVDSKLPEPRAKLDDITDEMEGTVRGGRLTVLRYMRYFGGAPFRIFILLWTVIGNSFGIALTFWLTIWVAAFEKPGPVSLLYFAGVYAAIMMADFATGAVQYLSFSRGAWLAARKLHEELLRGVLYAPLAWWKNIPVGRVVNRFSRDMSSLDSLTGDLAFMVVDGIVRILFRVGAISSILPVFMLPILFSIAVGILCGEMYTRTAVVLKRLSSSSHSPVFSQFGDTMSGLTVIRARGDMPKIFCNHLAKRFRPLSRTQEATFNLNRWVSVRIDFITAMVSVCAGIIAVTRAKVLGAGLVGFSLTNVAGLSSAILMLVRYLNDLEIEFQGFLRVEEYMTIEPEEKPGEVPETSVLPYGISGVDHLPPGWPRTGAVEFRNVTVRYDVDGQDILKDINLTFEAGERVAVIGRTGSGKSTLVLSLLRFTSIVSGQIFYDGVDITTIPRHKLRQALTIIPQEAVLFNGTLQSNLDPTGTAPRAVLERALESCHGIASFHYRNSSADTTPAATPDEDAAAAATERTPLLAAAQPASSSGTGAATPVPDTSSALSLSTPVKAKGENFSHGQRQVLSLCRALIRRSKLMLLDEATASMDYETDRGVQAVLRHELTHQEQEEEEGSGGRVLLTIAHRLRTIVDYDKVVVMGAGRVVEVGAPAELYARGGQFYEMVRHSGEGGELAALLGGGGGEVSGTSTEVGSE